MAVKITMALGAAACFGEAAASANVLGQRNFLASGMQPDVVARTLSNVQNEWKAQVAIAAECDTTSKLPGSPIVNCKDAHQSFDKSCGTIAGAIVQGSGGDKTVTNEYMGDVCSQAAMSGWHQLQCKGLALAVTSSMSADKYQNRISFKSEKLCSNLWSKLLDERVQETAKDRAEHDAAEKQAAEEEKTEIEEQKKEAEAKAKAEAQHKKEAEEEHEKQEVAARAAEAKAKAAEAAAKAEQKKAEAEAAKEAAEQKKAEAEAEEKRSAAEAAAAAKKKEIAKASAKVMPEPKAAVAAPVEKPAEKSLVAPKEVAEKASKFLVAAAAPAPAKAGAPAAGGAAGPTNKEVLQGKMTVNAAEQGFTGKQVKHEDGKTSAADWQSEYGNK